MNGLIAVITRDDSDLLNTMKLSDMQIEVLRPEETASADMDRYSAIALLGGTEETPMLFSPRDRNIIEEQLKKGKRIFAEYVRSISDNYYPDPVTTRYDRLVFCGNGFEADGLDCGDLLDDQCNMVCKPYLSLTANTIPILQYVNPDAHSRIEVIQDITGQVDKRGIWLDTPSNLMICSFRLCNFVRARFAPRDRWKSVIGLVLRWLCDENIKVNYLEDAYGVMPLKDGECFDERLSDSIGKAVAWFSNAGVLVDKGRGGALEGMATEIFPDGRQKVLPELRNDCTGETSMAFFMHYMLSGSAGSLEISDSLASVSFDYMQEKGDSLLKGMMRWSRTAWGVCYQDDAARTIIPQMLKCLYTGSRSYLDECVMALDFMVRTTGTDGTRVMRTDNFKLTPEEFQRLSSQPANYPSGHYNGYYHAALLLCYKLTGIERFREVAVKGLETIMAAYPETVREHSQTQEMCRLILPLSWLYWVTGKEIHRGWLYRVAEDLGEFKHPSGAYLEWDTGYKAYRSVYSKTEECSLLASNGDPIVDMLYSLNWLPVGFIQAYLVTGDEYFEGLWKNITRFMISAQLHSGDKCIDGAWARAFDVSRMEVFGMNKDTGWGPWAIESGWTVAEIVSGMMMGAVAEKLKPFYV